MRDNSETKHCLYYHTQSFSLNFLSVEDSILPPSLFPQLSNVRLMSSRPSLLTTLTLSLFSPHAINPPTRPVPSDLQLLSLRISSGNWSPLSISPFSISPPTRHYRRNHSSSHQPKSSPTRHQPISLQISISSLSRICPDIWSIRSWFLPRHSWFWSGLGLVEVGGTNGEDRFPVKTV